MALPKGQITDGDLTQRDTTNDGANNRVVTGNGLQLGIDPANREQMLEIIYGDRTRKMLESLASGHWSDWIETNPRIMLGKPVFKETRLTVELILENLGAGASEEDLLRAYPRLRAEHIRAAMSFAADSLRRPEPEDLRDT